jgi:hypothetical protein
MTNDQKSAAEEAGTWVPTWGEELGTRIREAADRLGSRESAAQAMGVTAHQLGRYIRGENQPTFLGGVGLARAAKVRVEWLATGELPRDERGAANPTDLALLQRAVAFVMELFREDGLIDPAADPQKVARLVNLAYDHAAADPDPAGFDFATRLKPLADAIRAMR